MDIESGGRKRGGDINGELGSEAVGQEGGLAAGPYVPRLRLRCAGRQDALPPLRRRERRGRGPEPPTARGLLRRDDRRGSEQHSTAGRLSPPRTMLRTTAARRAAPPSAASIAGGSRRATPALGRLAIRTPEAILAEPIRTNPEVSLWWWRPSRR